MYKLGLNIYLRLLTMVKLYFSLLIVFHFIFDFPTLRISLSKSKFLSDLLMSSTLFRLHLRLFKIVMKILLWNSSLIRFSCFCLTVSLVFHMFSIHDLDLVNLTGDLLVLCLWKFRVAFLINSCSLSSVISNLLLWAVFSLLV